MNEKPRVLVVEDDDSMRDLLTDLLSQEEYAVEEASDGAAAKAMLAQEEYDTVVADLVMPEVDVWSCSASSNTEPPRPP